MKKLFMTVLTTSALTSAALQALPLGNPSEASLLIDGVLWEGVATDPCDPCATWCDAISVRLGFYGDYVFNRFFKTSLPEVNGKEQVDNVAYNKKMTKSEVFTNAGYLALNIWDRFDVFGTLGATGLHIAGPSTAFNLEGTLNGADSKVTNPLSIGNSCVKLDGKHGFSWSVGVRGSLWECGCAALGGEAQYMGARPNINTIEVLSNTNPCVIQGDNLKAKYSEWQVGLGISYRINLLTPYIGIKWSKANVDFDNKIVFQPNDDVIKGELSGGLNTPIYGKPATGVTPPTGTTEIALQPLTDVQLTLNKIKSHKSFGFVVGSTLVDADKVSVTVEARFADERAIHVNSQFRF